ncbi:MAG TPA: enoyl-CoA hydratase-related protein [Polyangiaceae bacterium]
MDSVLQIERADGVATLTLNRPATRNALSPELLTALAAGIDEVSSDGTILAVVLTGAGRAFCSGADLKGAIADVEAGVDLDARIEQFHALIRGIVRSPKPFIAAVSGPAVGFGADLALACDLRVMSVSGYLQEKFVAIGLMPDGGGTFWLPRLVGLGRALEYLLLGTKLDAELALSLGLTSRVVAEEALLSEALSLARALSAGPPLAIRAIKRALREPAPASIDEALAREKTGQLALLRSADLREGVHAWSEGRTPTFRGR